MIPDRTETRAAGDPLAAWIAAGAEVFDVPAAERAPAWRARLGMNAPELEAVRRLPAGVDPIRLAPVAAVESLASATGIAARGLAGAGGAGAASAARARIASLGALNLVTHMIADSTAGDGVLSGVPFAVKDLMAVAGAPLSDGSAGRRQPPQEATVVARLRAAGAVPVALANLHEIAFGITGDNPHHGNAGNPHDPARITGGSSSGSAALVAAGAVPLAIGTDTAGSIRIPSALCGCVGFKPSYGLLPRDGVTTLAWSLDHVGTHAASVADAAAATFAMAGLELRSGGPAERGPLKLLRPANFFFDVIESSAGDAVEAALSRLAAAGDVRIERAAIPDVELAAAAQFATIAPEAFEAHRHRLETAPGDLSEDVRVRLEIGQFLRAADYVRAQRFRARLARTFAQAMGEGALLVTPTVPLGAPLRSSRTIVAGGAEWPIHTLLTRCTAPFNLTGLPAISLPCGHDANGMPIGLQLVAPYAHDGRLLAAAARVEAILSGEKRDDARC